MSETSTEPKRLWDIKHPYYSSESNYYTNSANDPGQEYESWADFFTDFGDSDPDMNLVFRWDWEVPDPADYEEGEAVPGEALLLSFVFQRKGIYAQHRVSVSRDDEPAIRAWLTQRARTIAAIWAPIDIDATQVRS